MLCSLKHASVSDIQWRPVVRKGRPRTHHSILQTRLLLSLGAALGKQFQELTLEVPSPLSFMPTSFLCHRGGKQWRSPNRHLEIPADPPGKWGTRKVFFSSREFCVLGNSHTCVCCFPHQDLQAPRIWDHLRGFGPFLFALILVSFSSQTPQGGSLMRIAVIITACHSLLSYHLISADWVKVTKPFSTGKKWSMSL